MPPIEEPEVEVEDPPEEETPDGEPEPEGEDSPPDEDGEDDDGDEGDDDGVDITIDDEPIDPAPVENRAPEWVRELRKNYRELQRENRELRGKQTESPTTTTLGAKPTLADADYDAAVYETKLAAWYEEKRKDDDAKAEAEKAEARQREAWKQTLEGYAAKKTALKVPDFDDAEGVILETLSHIQQGIIVQGAENPALVMYALGKNPKKAQEFAKITDPVKFSFAVAKLETKLKVTPRKPAAAPEPQVRGSGRISGSVNSTLERLRAKAEETGDYTQVAAFKRKQRDKKAS